jgi:hypothetical protein
VLERLPSSNNMYTTRQVQILSQQLELTFPKRKFRLTDKLSLCKFGILQAKKNSNLLDLHSIEEPIAALYALI